MKNVFVALLFCLLVAGIAGCEGLAQTVADPNSGLNVGIDATGKIVPVLTVGAAAAAAAGFPWAPVILLATNVITGLIVVYKNHQKNITEDKYNNTRATTKAIVDAVEAVAEIDHEDTTIGDIVKAKVEEKLKDKDWFLMGKIVIDTLKAE